MVQYFLFLSFVYVFSLLVLACFKNVRKKSALALWISVSASLLTSAVLDGVNSHKSDYRLSLKTISEIKPEVIATSVVKEIKNGDTCVRENVEYADVVDYDTAENEIYLNGCSLTDHLFTASDSGYFIMELEDFVDVERHVGWTTMLVDHSIRRKKLAVLPARELEKLISDGADVEFADAEKSVFADKVLKAFVELKSNENGES